MSVLRHISNDQREYMLYDSREKARRDSPDYLRDSAAYHAAETLAAKKLAAEANARAAEADARTAEADARTVEEKAKRAAAEAREAEEKARADVAEAQIAALAAKLARFEQESAPDGRADR